MKYQTAIKWLVTVMIASQLGADPLVEYDILEYGQCQMGDVIMPCIKMSKNGDIYLAVFDSTGQTLLWIIREKDGKVIYDLQMENLDKELQEQNVKLN